jgi:hypothetical protein
MKNGEWRELKMEVRKLRREKVFRSPSDSIRLQAWSVCLGWNAYTPVFRPGLAVYARWNEPIKVMVAAPMPLWNGKE